MKETTEELIEIRDELIYPYIIKKDPHCWILYKENVPETGTPYLRPVGYYANVHSCLMKIANIHPKQGIYNSLKEYVDSYKDYMDQIFEYFKKFDHLFEKT